MAAGSSTLSFTGIGTRSRSFASSCFSITSVFEKTTNVLHALALSPSSRKDVPLENTVGQGEVTWQVPLLVFDVPKIEMEMGS